MLTAKWLILFTVTLCVALLIENSIESGYLSLASAVVESPAGWARHTPLTRAIVKGNTSRVNQLLKQQPAFVLRGGYSAGWFGLLGSMTLRLQMAVDRDQANDSAEMVQAFLETGAGPNRPGARSARSGCTCARHHSVRQWPRSRPSLSCHCRDGACFVKRFARNRS